MFTFTPEDIYYKPIAVGHSKAVIIAFIISKDLKEINI